MTIDWTLPTLEVFLNIHKNNFPRNKKAGQIHPDTVWEQYEQELRNLHRHLSSLNSIQYRSYCQQAQSALMASLKAKEVELDKLIALGIQREQVQGDLHEMREIVKFNRARKGRK